PQASLPVQYMIEELFGLNWSKVKEQHKEYAEHLTEIIKIQQDAMDVYLKNNVSNRGVDPQQMKQKTVQQTKEEMWEH
ncbi:MAG: hypothetical protein ACOCQD_04685, partial [archaeon]